MTKKVFVLDTSALIAGFTPNLEEPKQYTVPEVLREARSMSVKLKLETAIRSGQVKVVEPPEDAMDEVMDEAEESGDRVSETDMEILALAYDLKSSGKEPEIVTDDYAMQNLAEILEIDYSHVGKPGISEVYEWEKECPACGKVYEDNNDITKCEVCGSRLKRRPKS